MFSVTKFFSRPSCITTAHEHGRSYPPHSPTIHLYLKSALLTIGLRNQSIHKMMFLLFFSKFWDNGKREENDALAYGISVSSSYALEHVHTLSQKWHHINYVQKQKRFHVDKQFANSINFWGGVPLRHRESTNRSRIIAQGGL